MSTRQTDDMHSVLRSFWISAAAALVVLGLVVPVLAQGFTAQDRADLQRIERYLNSITTMQARFTQIAPDATTATGTFYLSRPGRMRIDYDPPIPYLYVADGHWLTFWDGELGQRSDAPLGSTLADFFVRQNVRLSGDITVLGVRRGGGQVAVDVVQTDDPGAGQLTMVFSDQPLALQSWVVVDAQGQRTEVHLSDQRTGVALNNSLFRAPRPGRQPGRR